jgi:hypothetical protein
MTGEIVIKSNQKSKGQIKPKLTCDIPANNSCSQAGEEMPTNPNETGKGLAEPNQTRKEGPRQTQQNR